MKTSRRLILPVTVLILLSACAGLGRRLETPEVSLAHLQVSEMRVLETVFQADLRVINPNEIPIRVRGLDCTLNLNGREFARGISDAETEIPAMGTALVPVSVYSNLLDWIRSIQGLQGSDRLAYTLTGRLRLYAGALAPRTIPFSSEGTVSLGGLGQ